MTPEQYLEALLTLPGLYNPQVSRDGRWVAWTWFRTGPAADVYAAPTDGSRRADAPDRYARRTPPGLVDARQPRRARRAGPRRRRARAALPRRSGAARGVMRPLTEAEPHYFLHGGAAAPQRPLAGLRRELRCGDRAGDRADLGLPPRPGDRRAPRCWPARRRAAIRCPQLNEPGTHILYNRQDLHPAGQPGLAGGYRGRARTARS